MFFLDDESSPPPQIASAGAPTFEQAVAKRADRWLSLVSKIATSATPPSINDIHKLRVASRRLLVGLKLTSDAEGRLTKQLRRVLKPLRSAAGQVRDCDVHHSLLQELATQAPSDRAPRALADAVALINADRKSAADQIVTLARQLDLKQVRRQLRRLLQHAAKAQRDDHLQSSVRSRVELSRQALFAALSANTPLHELRLAIKDVRYSQELLAAAMGQAPPLPKQLAEVQARLGDLNDAATLADRLSGYCLFVNAQHASEQLATTKGLHDELHSLELGFRSVVRHRTAQFVQWWNLTNPLQDLLPPNLASTLADDFSTDNPASNTSTKAPVSVPNENVTMATNRFITYDFGDGLVAPSDFSHWPASDPAIPAHTVHQASRAPLPTSAGEASLWLFGWTLAIIDIGSNSVRLMVAEVQDDRSWTTIVEERAMTRLAHGLGESGQLCDDAISRTLDALDRFIATAKQLKAEPARLFATAAVREASNRDEFINLVHQRTGLTVEVLSAEDEGRLTHASVARIADLSCLNAAVADLGGGSLEVVFSSRGVITQVTSLPLGAVRLTEKFGGPLATAGPAFSSMRRSIEHSLNNSLRVRQHPQVLIGCGGTFTTLMSIAAAAHEAATPLPSIAPSVPSESPQAKPHSSPAPQPDQAALDEHSLPTAPPITRDTVRLLIKQLKDMPLEERTSVPGLHADRTDIIIAGMVTIERLMKRLGCNLLHVHTGGVREGLLLRIIQQRLASHADQPPPTVCRSAEILHRAHALAAAANCEQPHSSHVTSLALRFYDLLLPTHIIKNLGSHELERTLLEAASLLHDCGVLVAYAGHHKHSAAIIRNNGLDVTDPHIATLVATIARYHRKSGPTTRHRTFATLTAQDQDLVCRLAAILRIADGLDRTHKQLVADLALSVGKRTLRISIHPAPKAIGVDLSDELAAATAKADVFEHLTQLNVDILA